MTWEIFKARVHYRPRAVTPEVFIRMPKITFNKACTNWLESHGATRINYLFDKDNNRMAVKPAPVGQGYSLHFGVAQSDATISAFVLWAGIREGKYAAELSQDVIEINLSQVAPAPVARKEGE